MAYLEFFIVFPLNAKEIRINWFVEGYSAACTIRIATHTTVFGILE